MNKRQKEILEELLEDEKRTLEELEEAYDDALAQINGRIENLLARQDADMQHVIYQVEYQRQLKTQVQAILETLQSNEFDTISQYLTRSYENGFMGTMYDLHGQGIPMIFPIDQAQVADAIRHQTKLSSTLYTALGLDINDLSKKIAGEISRGMSSGQGYDEMARNISAWARIPQNNAMRIARTEAHRIQCRAAMDAQYKAKDKGADVVKQWDAALDGETRPNHRKLDGQIRELDEPFEVAGMKAMYPGDFGDPGEDCNCRCAILQRARWALDSSELETLRQRAEVMGEYDSYNEFRDSYNRALNELYEDSQPVRSSVQMMNDDFVPAKTIKEAEEYAQQFVSDIKTKYSGNISYANMDLEYANTLNRVLTNTFRNYNCGRLSNITPINFREKRFRNSTSTAAYEWGGRNLFFNGRYFLSEKALENHIGEANNLLQNVVNNANILLGRPGTDKTLIQAIINTGRQCVSQSYDFAEASFIHEMGHFLDDEVFKLQLTTNRNFIVESMRTYAANISGYATSSSAEYVAESYAAFCYGEIDILDPKLVEIFKGAMRNG